MPAGPNEDQRPEYLVLRGRRTDRRDAHAGHAGIEHVGAMRRRIAPARKGLGERVVACGNVLARPEGRIADPVLKWPPDVVVHLVVRHGVRLLAG